MLKLENGAELDLYKVLYAGEKMNINASLVAHADHIYCAYRTDNLDNYDAGNYLTKLDRFFRPIIHIPLIGANGNTAFEDVRLFSFKNALFAIYTYLPGDADVGWTLEYGVEIGLVDLNTGVITRQKSLRKYADSKHSKNWIPMEDDGNFYIITDFSPFLRILKTCPFEKKREAYQYHVSENQIPAWNYGEIRGGTPFIRRPSSQDGWQYCFVHSHINVPNGQSKSRYYVYTILRFNFLSKQVEYFADPLGFSRVEGSEKYNQIWLHATRNMAMKVVFPMGIMNYENGLIMSFGKDDCISRAIFYDWNYIENLFAVDSKNICKFK